MAIQSDGVEMSFASYAAVQIELITGKRRWERMDPVATLLSMTFDPDAWQDIPIFPVDNAKLSTAWKLEPGKQRRISMDFIMTQRGVLQTLSSDSTDVVQLQLRVMAFTHLREDFRIIPPPISNSSWLSPDELSDPSQLNDPALAAAIKPDAPLCKAASSLVDSISDAASGSNTAALGESVSAFLSLAQQNTSYMSSFHRKLDEFGCRLDAFHKAAWAFVLAALAFAFSVVRRGQPRQVRYSWWIGTGLLTLGALGVVIGLTILGVLTGRMPVANMYESLTFTIAAFAVAAVAFEVRLRQGWVGLCAAVTAFAALTLIHNLPVHMRRREPLVAVLDSAWLNFHVTTLMVSYGLFLMAFIFSLLYLMKDYSHGRPRWMPDKELFERMTYRSIQVGWPLLGIGIFLGAVWANTAWGSYWSWDPKETWALITWLVYALYLHLRINRGWSGRRSVWVAVLGFIMVLITYFGVAYLPGLAGGLHSYA